MLKMLTFFQGLPGQQPVSGAPDFPRSAQKLPSTSEAESEASMSEASSEDLVPSLEAEVATDRDEEEAGKKKKKSKGLATMFSVFTKRRKKKGQPSLAETEGESESSLQPPAQLPTGRREPLSRWAGSGQHGGSLECMPRSAGTERAGHVGVKGLPSLLSPAAPDLRI